MFYKPGAAISNITNSDFIVKMFALKQVSHDCVNHVWGSIVIQSLSDCWRRFPSFAVSIDTTPYFKMKNFFFLKALKIIKRFRVLALQEQIRVTVLLRTIH